MRLVAGLFALTLTGSLAFAESPKAPDPQPEPARTKVALRVVKIMPESHQVLLFDKNHGTHVLADVGSSIGDYEVEAIEGDEVTLTDLGGREIVLAAPVEIARPRSVQATHGARTVAATPADPYGDDGAPADPYGEDSAPADPYADASDGAPANPYADPDAPEDPYGEAPVRVAEAPRPIAAGEGGVRVSSATGEPAAPAPATSTPAVPTLPAVVTVPDPAPARPSTRSAKRTPAKPAPDASEFAAALTGAPSASETAPAVDTDAGDAAAPAPVAAEPAAVVLAKKDVKAALADFGVLTSSIHGAFTPEGARIDAVTPSSVFAKAGLRSGDVVTSVDGRPVRSIDDAADLYIRASTARSSTVQLLRGGKRITLRLAIH